MPLTAEYYTSRMFLFPRIRERSESVCMCVQVCMHVSAHMCVWVCLYARVHAKKVPNDVRAGEALQSHSAANKSSKFLLITSVRFIPNDLKHEIS